MIEKSPFAVDSDSPCKRCPIRDNISRAKFNISVKCERFPGNECKYAPKEKHINPDRELE